MIPNKPRPAREERLLVPADVLERTRELLAAPGLEGVEAVVVWLARRSLEDPLSVEILAEFMPPQLAYRGEEGLSVTVPEWAIAELIQALPQDVFVAARVHTHPTQAYHSPVDDTNMLLSHQGAISIVVPDFATAPIDLSSCSVNELDDQFAWRELSGVEVVARLLITGPRRPA